MWTAFGRNYKPGPENLNRNSFRGPGLKGTRLMEYSNIQSTEMNVSRIALGTWAIGGWMWGGTDDEESVRTILEAFHQGINLIDTAPVYGFGHSESVVGQALARYGSRDKIYIATKVGLEWHDGNIERNSSSERIRREIEDSLRRLQTDYIDLYQVHWPDPLVPIEDTAETLRDLLDEGKIRAIGVSNYSTGQMERFHMAAPLHTVQPPYNLFERQIEHNVLPFARSHHINVLAYGPLCRGLLSGRMHADSQFTGDDLRKIDPKFQPPRFEQYLKAVQELDDFARTHYGKRAMDLAVRWLLDQPGVTVALWGARHPQQIADASSAVGWSLDPGALAEIDRIVSRNVSDPVGPEFMAPPERTSIPEESANAARS
jgi:aryl-alcohol dehydrogenase-like predicted oxidoreductase